MIVFCESGENNTGVLNVYDDCIENDDKQTSNEIRNLKMTKLQEARR